MKRMIGLSLGLKYLNEAFFAKMKASGVEAVEISCATGDYDKLDYAAIKAAADKEGITLWSFHYPFGYYNIASLKEGRCEETVAYHSELTRKASAIGIKRFEVVVFHKQTNLILVEYLNYFQSFQSITTYSTNL